jgi:hypothetical protein
MFKGKLWQYWDGESVIGLVLNWILPIALCYLTLWALSKSRPDSSRKFFKKLVVIAAILACAFLLNSVFCTLRPIPARKALARMTLQQLRLALQYYYEDVGYYPTGDAERDEGNINMVLALSDAKVAEGGKGGPNSPYYLFKERDLKPSEYVPSRNLLVDPWGKPWRYRRAEDDQGNIKPSIHNKDSYDLWSCGPNMKDEKGLGDDIANWD